MTKFLRKSALFSLIAIFAVLSVLCAVFALSSDTEKARASEGTGFEVVGVGIATYPTFAEAWSEAINTSNAIITMHENATVSETLTIAAGKTILLNLNGHELKFTGTSGSVFSVSGTFTLKDEENTTLSHEITSPVTNEKVTIEGGLITGGGKATDMGGDTHGGAVYVNIGGTFNMHGGTLAGNTVTGAGGAVSNDGTFNMSGGTISDNTAATYGGGVRNGITFNMSGDAKILNNEATSATAGEGGGGVCNFGTFTMEGNAVISGNSARDGGGVFNKDVFTMEGGTIECNIANGWTGGGVRNDATFNMRGTAKIKNNEANMNDEAGEGGGVFNQGTFTMEGNAEISGNNSKNGGGVNNAGTFTMSGGTIEGNTAAMGGGLNNYNGNFTMSGFSSISGNTASYGGGVYFDSGTFKVSGAVNITGNKNTNDGKNDNAYLYEAITVEGPLTDGGQKAQIGLSEQSRAYVATKNYSEHNPDESPYNFFISDRENGCLALANNEVNVYTSHVYGFAPKSCMTCGYIPEAYYDAGGEICGNFSDVWEQAGENTVYLNKDIEIAETLVVPSGKTKKLSLNNHKLTYTGASGSAIRVEGTFMLLADSTSNLTEKTFKDPNTNTDVTVKGGLLTGGKGSGNNKLGGGVFVANGGSFTMNAGNIAGNTGDFGGGVRVDDNGSFIMQGGSICYNKAEKDGGGLCVCNAKKISLEGGTINNNSAGAGGGVYFEGASTTDFEGYSVTKTVIKNNAAVTVANMDYSGAGGGIYIDGAVVEITGGREEVQYITVYGEIKQNTATVRGGGVFVDSEATLEVGGMAVISGNKVDGNSNNVYVYNDGAITVSSPLETEQVLGGDSRPIARIYLNNGTVNGYTQDDSPWEFIRSDDSTKCAKLGDNGIVTLEDHDYQKRFDESEQKYKVTCSNCGNSKMIYYLRVGTELIISGSRIAAVSGSSGGQFPVSDTDEPSWGGNKNEITKVTIRDGVTPMSTAAWFKGCSSLTTVDLSGLSSTYLTDMNNMFSGCSVLGSIVFPNGFTAEQVTDMSYLFNGCSALTTLDVSGFNTSLVNNMANMFYGCTALTALDISGFNTSFVTDMSHMFHNCWTLKTDKFKLPTSFDTANVTNMTQMFFGCQTLTALDFPDDFNTANVTTMMGMFNGCTALTTVDLSGFNTAEVTDMSGMFYACNALVSDKDNPLVFPSTFNTANVTDMSNMFAACWILENLDLSGFDTVNVSDMSYMFYYCYKLTAITFSDSFNTANVTNMDWMFADCEALKTLDLSAFDTSSVTRASAMFNSCSALNEIKAPQTIGTVALPLPCKFWDGTVVDGTVVGDVNPISAEQAGKTLYRHAQHSYGDWQSATAATCTNAGTVAHKDCSVCGKHFNEIGGEIGSIVDSTAPALGHDFATEFTVDREPSCTDSGSKSKHCSRCSEKTEVTEIAALGHAYGAPTYFWNGNECIATRICSRVAAHEESETVTATSVVTAPTCTTGGYTTLTATFANSAFATQSQQINQTPALGHSFGTPAYVWSGNNCTATRVCSRDASHTETETVAATSQTVAPTCTAGGYTVLTAMFTNTAFATQTKQTNPTAATGHSYGEWEILTEPTCSAIGAKKRVCSVCNHEETETIAINPDAHGYGEWTVTRPSTLTEFGEEQRVCSHNQEHIETRQLPKRVPELTKPDENGGETDEVIVSQENGLSPDVELFVTRIAEENYAQYDTIAAAANGVVGFVYDVTLKSGGVTVQPDGTLTVKLRIPENLLNKQFKIFHLHGGTATDTNYTVEGSYAVLTTDKLSEFVFVGEKSASVSSDGSELSGGAIAGITIAVIIAVLIAAYIACYFAFYRKGILKGKVFDVIYVPLNAVFKKNNEQE